MVRTSFFALALLLAGTGTGFAETAYDAAPAVTIVTRSDARTIQPRAVADWEQVPGPHTVVYREWSDLAG
jgi:hypothetical protein